MRINSSEIPSRPRSNSVAFQTCPPYLEHTWGYIEQEFLRRMIEPTRTHLHRPARLAEICGETGRITATAEQVITVWLSL